MKDTRFSVHASITDCQPSESHHCMQLDFFIVCTSVLLIAAESVDGLQAIKAFRVLRALKPLRTLTHSAGMLLVLKSVTSVAAMANVSLLMLLVFVIFGVMGMQLFSGLLYRCGFSQHGQPMNAFGMQGTEILPKNNVQCKHVATVWCRQ